MSQRAKAEEEVELHYTKWPDSREEFPEWDDAPGRVDIQWACNQALHFRNSHLPLSLLFHKNPAPHTGVWRARPLPAVHHDDQVLDGRRSLVVSFFAAVSPPSAHGW